MMWPTVTMGKLLIILSIMSLVSTAKFNKQQKTIFNSKKDLEKVVQSESTLYWIISNYTQFMEQRTQILKNIKEDFEMALNESKNGIEEYLDNPISSFHLIRRIVISAVVVETILTKDIFTDNDLDLKAKLLVNAIKLPNMHDLSYAAMQVKKLQDTYQLTAKEMADGGPFGIPFNSGDCFLLGKDAYENEDLDHAYDWLNEAWDRVSDGRSNEEETVEYLAAVAYMKGRTKRALKLTERLLELHPEHNKAAKNLKHYKKKLQKIKRDRAAALKKDIVPEIVDWYEEDIEELTSTLCNGDLGKSKIVEAKLKCRWANKNNAFVKLAPFKEEDVYINPRIVLYHDILSDEDIDLLQKAALPYLSHPSTEDEGSAGVTTAWITINNERINTVSRRASDFSGLSLDTADLLHIYNYEQNGSYTPHLDGLETLTSTVRKTGNRLATINFFLDNAEGGDSVFPALKLTVPARKGSALVWFNLLKNGALDDLSMHGTCPIKSSSHWEAVKWVRSFGNEFNRQCDLNMQI